MKLSLAERETILLYNQAEPMAEIYTHDPRLMEKLDLLAKKHPDQITRKDAHNFTVPKRCVSVLSLIHILQQQPKGSVLRSAPAGLSLRPLFSALHPSFWHGKRPPVLSIRGASLFFLWR